MFGRLLTPLVTPLVNHFDLSPRPGTAFENGEDQETASAENFARDVIIEVMRNSVESLKVAYNLDEKIQTMNEIQRIMIEEPCTKDVFRELDGYLLLINVLSILHSYIEQEGSELMQIEECERLAFNLLAESMNGNIENSQYFQNHVGYTSLEEALKPLLMDQRTADLVFGFLLSLAHGNFALSSVFGTLRSQGKTDFDGFKELLRGIKNPACYVVLVTSLTRIPAEDIFLPKAVFALVETAVCLNHRNKALLSGTQLFRHILDRVLLSDVPNAKILKRLFDIGAETEDVRYLFQHAVTRDGALNPDVLEIIRSGMKARWPMHFSMEGVAALQFGDQNVRGLPSTGFTFMIWLYVERFPNDTSYPILKIQSKSRVLFCLSIRREGILELLSSENSGGTLLEHSKIGKSRWTHVVLIHHPHRATNPTIRVFVDGVLSDSRQWAYPRTESTTQTIRYIVGSNDSTLSPRMSWSIASSYLLSLPLSDEIPNIIQHLGPRYYAHFQTKDLYRFLTYEASTSLNIFLSSLVSQRTKAGRIQSARTGIAPSSSSTLRILMDGIGVAEEGFLFSITALGSNYDNKADGNRDVSSTYIENGVCSPKASADRMRLEILGDVVSVTRECLDTALWKIGGAAVTLRLVELASTPHELSRTLGIFADGSRNSWQMSEDMEYIHAFDILAHILYSKAQLINLTAFETLFEFLGLNFRNPDRSAVVNTIAYRAIALDFGLWASTKTEIQQMHLEHFATLLRTSKHRSFNAKQRIAKFGVVRRLLFVLHTNWYSAEMDAFLVSALKCVAQACFSAEDTIKPIVSFLAANLHEDGSQELSPRSIVSQLDRTRLYNKAEQVLVAFVSILSMGRNLASFSSVLPLPRICLLLLGDKPSPTVAVQILTIISLALKMSTSFIRKFELVSGWTVLRVTLPAVWNVEVQRAAFDVLLGQVKDSNEAQSDQRGTAIVCPQMISAILAALDHGLSVITQDVFDEEATDAETFVETLLEELIDLQSSSASFRQAFKSQQTTALLISTYSVFVSKATVVEANRRTYIRVLEKLNHFAVALALDNAVSSSQKQQVLSVFQQAETLLNLDLSNESVTTERHAKQSSDASRTHAGVHMLSERAYIKTATKIREWRKSIVLTERKRLRRTAMDIREHRHHVEQTSEWRDGLYDDRGLWAMEGLLHSWILDETEGPCRVRKKLQRKRETLSFGTSGDQTRVVTEPESDAQSFIQVELVVPPWAEGYEFQPHGGDEWIDEFSDDKLRRVRHELESGDVIDAVCTVTRIVGVDSSPGLLILGRTHLYMLDGLVENEDGEIVEACHAPRNLFSVPGSVLELDGGQSAQKWTYDLLASFSRKTCLFRDVALELYFKDNRSLLIVFPNKQRRQEISDKLANSVVARSTSVSRSPLVLHRTPLLGRATTRVMTDLRDELATAQRKWQAREISNFTYLSILNQTSGRTPGDATQYPVFPWVLADYSSASLDLTSASTFRDLTKPMGALSDARCDAARQRYENLKSVGEAPFHYGTHFSSSMIVCHFLIRLEPFTHMFKTLQGGDWDLPDRLFTDIARAYNSASLDLRGDVRELIPEFFTCPEFLQNLENVNFGVQQNTGEKIHDVKLPPWAKGDPLLFVIEHRKALESDFVSENLPSWIDLIWGYKQRDVNSLNVFHPFSYEGSIDLDQIKDELERKATVGIIHNFGQTPRKLFDAPHPSRILQGPTTLPLGTQYGAVEDFHLLVQSPRPVAEISEPVASLAIDMVSERVIPCPAKLLCVPSYPHEQIAWGYVDQSIKLLIDGRVTQVVETISCICVAFVDSDRFVTGSADFMVRFWDLKRKDGKASFSKVQMLRCHTAAILCIAACKAWSLVVSGSGDGTAIIWDLNRAIYSHSIDHKIIGDDVSERSKVHLVAINESTGNIATCSDRKLCLHTINAHQIAELDLTHSSPTDGRITSLAFHEREYARLGMLATGMSSGAIVLRTWTASDTPAGERAQWKFYTLKKLRCREGYDDRTPMVTALQFIGESLYHGEEGGKVFSWDLPD
ncbi:beach-domain-containing protein [Fomitiporia mediterranea MF3/22]|uniref:beach-domain-containing protein n=1 Tax=Fomitiporia mediterranea (strain MF3/22) TaxID=694068 RepID=UPI0004407C7F|nr:beach-domain-containing protein [Fomitiporia mediterranea MF3/22]EJC99617.1 beach-domain-containing protein [Fomitiporia mediterranea MF3/22]